ncbi:HEAT repeat domain-containing protein, partial [candidate division WOR-3 bacterium]|nr:HEAT repeat domain-containing protein [candidate division WOR-3 bacterium]
MRLSLRGLISGLQSPDPAVRRGAVEALRQIGGDEAAGALVLMLQDPEDTVRLVAGE